MVNGRIFYIFASNHVDVSGEGIPPDMVIAILRDPLKGCVPGNLEVNRRFPDRIYEIAGKSFLNQTRFTK